MCNLSRGPKSPYNNNYDSCLLTCPCPQLQFPAGAFDCWAYMTCNEAIQAIMARLDAESLMSATSSLLLVRAELWRYALEKVGILLWIDSFGNSLECPYAELVCILLLDHVQFCVLLLCMYIVVGL